MSGLIAISADLVTPKAFAIDTDAISTQVAEYAKLTISGIEDKEGLKAVRAARLELRRVRTSIEKKREELKEGSLVFGRKVDSVAKELTGLVEPTEKKLHDQEKEIDRLIAEIVAKKLADRDTALRAVNAIMPPLKLLESLSDAEFDLMLGNATKANAERLEREAELARQEQIRKDMEEMDRQAEQDRLRKEREELEAERAKQREERARIDEQRRQEQEEFRRRQEESREALEAERREMEREIRRLQEEQEEERRKVQAERAAIEAEKAERARQEQEAIEAKERAERDEQERQEEERRRVEAEQALIEEERLETERLQREAEERQRMAELMRPVREKVDAFIDAVMSAARSVATPEIGDEALSSDLTQAVNGLELKLRYVAHRHLDDPS